MEFAKKNGSKATPSTPSSQNEELIKVEELKRTDAALRRLGVFRKQLDAAPQITPLLKRADGGLTHVLAAMRLSQDDTIQTFFQKYDAVPVGDRERLPIEAIALAAEVDIHYLLGSILLALEALAVNTTRIIATTYHPKITEARVTYGMLPFGEKDRTAIDTAVGFLPAAKPPTFIGKAIFGTGKAAMEEQGAEGGDDKSNPDDYDLDRLFPPANAMQEKLVPIRNRLLPEGNS